MGSVCVCEFVHHMRACRHVTGRLFSESVVVTPYLRFPSGITYSVFINDTKVDAGCVRVVKLLQAWRHVIKQT